MCVHTMYIHIYLVLQLETCQVVVLLLTCIELHAWVNTFRYYMFSISKIIE